MIKLSKEIKVAILVISSIVLFYWGFYFLKGKNLFDNSFKLYVVYDNVAGLTPASPITLNGLVIGKVNSIHVIENGKMQVEMIITNEEAHISKTAIAEIQGNGLMGGKEIAILHNFDNPTQAKNGEYLKASSKLGLTDELAKQIEPLKDKIEKLLDNANQLFEGVNKTLDENTQANLRLSISNLSKTLAEFSQLSKDLNGLIADNKPKLDKTLTNFEKTSVNLVKISDSLAQADFKGTISKLETTLTNVNSLLKGIDEGKGSMGKLVKDEALYNNFEKASKELELLLQDLRLNPVRYINISVFGKKNKPYQTPDQLNTN